MEVVVPNFGYFAIPNIDKPQGKRKFLVPRFLSRSKMKKVLALVGFALIGSSYALDEYLPVEAKKLEVDVAYGLMNQTGMYDDDGKKQDLADGSSTMLHTIPLQLKYGIMPGLDVEVLWAFGILGVKQDAIPTISPEVDTSLTGFGQPEIGFKYAMMDIGAGAYVNYVLPFATGDFSDPAPAMALSFGLVYTKLLMPQFNLTGQLNYRLNFEDEDKFQDGNVITVYAKPEFRFNQFGGAYLGVRYDMTGTDQADGDDIKNSDGYLVTLAPGWNATWLPTVSTEVNVPLTILGQNNGASWDINAAVYVTLPM